mmetsp:Transcript_98079/g.280654  ORF Transcript_98079/g.280654 Transcript_98079/m.280654 type:complete len:605 (-) Transcript_98079:87-1901(-)
MPGSTALVTVALEYAADEQERSAASGGVAAALVEALRSGNPAVIGNALRNCREAELARALEEQGTRDRRPMRLVLSALLRAIESAKQELDDSPASSVVGHADDDLALHILRHRPLFSSTDMVVTRELWRYMVAHRRAQEMAASAEADAAAEGQPEGREVGQAAEMQLRPRPHQRRQSVAEVLQLVGKCLPRRSGGPRVADLIQLGCCAGDLQSARWNSGAEVCLGTGTVAGQGSSAGSSASSSEGTSEASSAGITLATDEPVGMALGDLFGDIVELARMGSSAQLAQLLNTGARAGLPPPLLSRLEEVSTKLVGNSIMHTMLPTPQLQLPSPPRSAAVPVAVATKELRDSPSVSDEVVLAVQLERDSYEWVDTEEGVRVLMRQLKQWADADGPSNLAEATRPVMLCGIDTEWGDACDRGDLPGPSVVQIAVRVPEGNGAIQSRSTPELRAWVIDSAVHGTHLESVVELLQWILSLSPAHVVPLGFAFDHDCTQIAALAARRFSAESERGDDQPKGDVEPEEGVGPMAVVDLQAVAVARGGGAWGGGTPGLGKVSARWLGKDVSKKEQCSDWDRRPLTASQLHYAAADAAVLVEIAEHMGFTRAG